MTHEPECQKADLGCGQYPCVEVCICDEIRSAYQRGLEDAAKAVATMRGAVTEPVQVVDVVALAITAIRGLY